MERFYKRIEEFSERLENIKKSNLYFYLNEIESLDGPYAIINGRRMLMLASYSYLGLIGHPLINEYAIEAIKKYGTGTHGVRILAGTEKIHSELEQTIATFKNREAAVVFSSGYVTNLTSISTFFGRGDVVICDKLDHASIVDGCLLSGAEFLRFNHNDLKDLQRKLEKTADKKTRVVIIDAVYSMDGDISPVPDILELVRKYNALLMVDEAHSLGVLGENGTGIEEYFGLNNEIDILMGTLSKTIPSVGGYIAGSKDVVDYLKHNARAFVFSAALPPAACAAAIASFKVIKEEKWRIKKLSQNINYFISELNKAGFNTLNSKTAVVPLIIGDEDKTLQVNRYMQDRDIFVLPILHPAVPPNTSRLRMNVTALMDKEHIDFVVNTLKEADKIFKIT